MDDGANARLTLIQPNVNDKSYDKRAALLQE